MAERERRGALGEGRCPKKNSDWFGCCRGHRAELSSGSRPPGEANKTKRFEAFGVGLPPPLNSSDHALKTCKPSPLCLSNFGAFALGCGRILIGNRKGDLVVLWLVVFCPTWSPSWMERWRRGGKLNMAAVQCGTWFCALRSTAVRHSKAVKTPRDHEQLARRTLQQHGVCATERLLPSQTKTKMFANLLRTSFFFSAPAVSQREQISSMSNEGREQALPWKEGGEMRQVRCASQRLPL